MCSRLFGVSLACALVLWATGLSAHPWQQAQQAAQGRGAQEANQARDPILANLQLRLQHTFQQEHLPTRLYYEEGVLMADYHTRHEKIHGLFKTGEESAQLSDMVVPAPEGLRLELQVEAGKFIGQAVRPQQLHAKYRTQTGKQIEWTTYLDQYWFQKANKTLLVNLSYGKQVKPQRIEKIVMAIRAYATSQGATEGQTMP
jgi:hypothetical protein